MHITRRQLLVGCAAAGALATTRLTGLAFARTADAARGDLLVMVFLRGGCDGLSLAAPADDRQYLAARPGDLRVAGRGRDAGLPLRNAFAQTDFRLHPKAAPLRDLYDNGALAIVHACGLTNATRSHFEAMDLIERGAAADKNLTSGWLTRHLAVVGAPGALPAVDGSASAPGSLLGSGAAVAITDVGGFALYGDEEAAASLRRLYQGDTPLHRAGLRTLSALDVVGKKVVRDRAGNPVPYKPAVKAGYPMEGEGAPLATPLQTIAQLVKMDVGLQVATADYGGWDTHEYQAALFPGLVDGLSRALNAFYNDLARYQARLTVVVMSEFGRRLKANESGGTDHGHGNVMLVLGGNVNGGRMYGRWPGLATDQLDQGADLAITTDYRTVLSELVVRRLGNRKLGAVFPKLSAYRPLDVVRGEDGTVELA